MSLNIEYLSREHLLFELVVLLLSALISATVAVNFLTKDKEIELTNIIIKDKRSLFEEASNLINMRLYSARKLIWKMKEKQFLNKIDNTKSLSLKKAYHNYRETVDNFNVNVRKIAKQLIYVFDRETSELLAKENNDPHSCVNISQSFHELNRNLVYLYDHIVVDGSMNYTKQLSAAEKQIETIQNKLIKFMDILARKCFDKEQIRRELKSE